MTHLLDNYCAYTSTNNCAQQIGMAWEGGGGGVMARSSLNQQNKQDTLNYNMYSLCLVFAGDDDCTGMMLEHARQDISTTQALTSLLRRSQDDTQEPTRQNMY